MSATNTFKPEDVLAYECKHATLALPPRNSQYKDDFHFVKEVIHLKNGEKTTNFRRIRNYQRDFWVTKPGFQKYQQKKEWQDINKLNKFTTHAARFEVDIARALDLYSYNGNRRQLFNSPYLYGADITTTALLKHRYQTGMAKAKVEPTRGTVAGFDVETDVVHGTKDIIIATMSFKDKVYTAVTRSFVDGVSNPVNRAHEIFDHELKDIKAARGITWELEIVENSWEILKNCFAKAHEWGPDFVEIWNIDYDVPKMIEVAQFHQMDLADIISDPSVPPPYRFFTYNQGPRKRKVADGSVMTIKNSLQWHTVTCPAKFQFIDGMLCYRQVRTGAAEERSYSLDATLERENVGVQKLRCEGASHVPEGSLVWHEIMQTTFKLEYIVYAAFDCISMEMLEEKIQDIGVKMPIFAKASDLQVFNSQPRRKVTELHFDLLEDGLVIGTTGDMKIKLDDEIYQTDGLIITLKLWVADTGLPVLKDVPGYRTNVRVHVGDGLFRSPVVSNHYVKNLLN